MELNVMDNESLTRLLNAVDWTVLYQVRGNDLFGVIAFDADEELYCVSGLLVDDFEASYDEIFQGYIEDNRAKIAGIMTQFAFAGRETGIHIPSSLVSFACIQCLDTGDGYMLRIQRLTRTKGRT